VVGLEAPRDESRESAGLILEVAKAEQIIDAKVIDFMQWLASRDAVPTIRALRDQGERARRHEVERVRERGERGQDGEGPQADPREAVDPGREREPGEDEDRAGQARYDHADDADQDQPGGQEPEDERAGRPGHGVRQPRSGVTTSFQTRRAPAALYGMGHV